MLQQEKQEEKLFTDAELPCRTVAGVGMWVLQVLCNVRIEMGKKRNVFLNESAV